MLYSTNFTKFFFSNIRDGKVEVMPLPPKNYSELKVKELDLRESIILQQEQDKKLKKIQLQNALDKLTSGGGSSNDHIGKRHAPEKSYQFPLNTSCFGGSTTRSMITSVAQFHEILVYKDNKQMKLSLLLNQKFVKMHTFTQIDIFCNICYQN